MCLSELDVCLMYIYQMMAESKGRIDANHNSDGTTILGKTQVNPFTLLLTLLRFRPSDFAPKGGRQRDCKWTKLRMHS